MSKELTTTGSKKVKTLMKEFNDLYPYLNLSLYPMTEKHKLAKGLGLFPVGMEQRLVEIRTKTGTGEITFRGNKKIETIEKEFDEIFGLFVQIGWTDSNGKKYYSSEAYDKMTLTQLNADAEKRGCKKGL